MAVLEKIRTKGGWLILVIISIALLSFIIDPSSIQSVSNMFSSANDVGEMNGNRITANEYEKEVQYYTNVDQLLYQTTSFNEEQNENIKERAWYSFIIKNILDKQFNEIGVGCSDAEVVDYAKGENLAMVVRQLFTNPQTGELNRDNLNAFWANSQNNPDTQVLINYLENEIRRERQITKYAMMVSKSNFVNNIELDNGVASRSANVEFNYVLDRYPATVDSTISISDSEIKKYYEENKKHFEQGESRDVEYVVFSILPSEDDMNKAKSKIDEIVVDFAKTKDPMQYATLNSDVAPSTKYFKKEELASDVADFAFSASKEDVLPPYLDGYKYKTARIGDIKDLPDSVRARHILISYEQTQESYNAARKKADSLLNLIKSTNGAAFAAVAIANGTDGTAQQGGDLGWFRDGAMVQPFNDSCFMKPVGKLMLVETQFGFHILQVTARGKEVKKVQLATIEREIIPSKATSEGIFASANDIVTSCGGDYNKFNEVVKEKGLQVQMQQQIERSAKRFANYGEAREFIRWVYDAKLHDVSSVMDINNRQQFIIAALTKIREKGFAPLEDQKSYITEVLRTQKQHELTAVRMKSAMEGATTLEAVGEKLGRAVQQSLDGTNFGSNYISGLGADPKLSAAISASNENKLYGPVIGDIGVYSYIVTGKKIDEGYNKDLEKQRIMSFDNSRNIMSVLTKAANMTDVRAKFF